MSELGAGQMAADLRRAYAFRHLIPFFSRRLLEKRYARTWLGWLWLPLRPLIDILSRVLLFGSLLGVPSSGKPYVLFFLTGMASWQLLENTGHWATRAMELTRAIYRKVYIPRLTALVAAVAPSLVELLIYTSVLAVATVYFVVADGKMFLELGLDVELLELFAGIGLLLMLGLVLGLFTSVFGARARDFRLTYGYLSALWLYVTPVIYPLDSIPKGFQAIVRLNPATAPIEMIKSGVLGSSQPPMISVAITLVVLAVGLATGLRFFLRWERQAAETL